MSSAFKLSIEENGIAKLIFDLPDEKVNKLTVPVLEELDNLLDNVKSNPNIKVLLFTSGKEDIFIAGADIRSFEEALGHSEFIERTIRTGHRVFSKIGSLPFPTIAVINGACLGGGLELALACTFRVVSDHPKTILGLPEVSLGIFPAWGGTARLPKLVGLIEGVPLILTGKTIKAFKAWKIKLADAIFAWEFFDQKVQEFVAQCLTPAGKDQILKRRRRKGLRYWLVENNFMGRYFFFKKAKKEVLKKTKGRYPAPLVALQLIEKTYTLPLKDRLDIEIDTFLKNIPILLPNAQNLIRLFFIQENLKKDPGVREEVKPFQISSTGVLGAGTMGSTIAWLMSSYDYPVRFKDINWEAIGKGYASANALYSNQIKKKRLKPSEANLKFHHLSGSIDYRGFQHAQIVIEAAVESLDLKHKIFAELEEVVKPGAIIASNTSSLTISEMTKSMRFPERFIGMHFFNPADKMPLVEIVPGKNTTQETIATAVAFCKKLNKTPIVVGDCPGFLVNRIFVLGANEINWMLQEGVELERLERIMLDFGMPMSPFILSDEVGNDVSYKVSKAFEEAYGERMKAPEILKVMYDKKLFGKKVGRGFYIYKGKKTHLNPEIKQILKSINSPSRSVSDQEIVERMIFGMVNESARCLDENIIGSPAYLDMALIMGIGFPPFRGGLLRYADERGVPYIVDRLHQFEKQYGPRFKPCDRLIQTQRFY